MHVSRTARGLIIEANSEGETDRIGRALADRVSANTVIGLIGPLGAGKTRLVRALAEGLGVDPGAIASPTFVLIHEYDGRLPVYHFDAYRLGGPDDFEALGAAEYFEAGGVCLVEWADLVPELLQADAWQIRIESTGPSSRLFACDWPAFSAEPDLLKQALTEPV